MESKQKDINLIIVITMCLFFTVGGYFTWMYKLLNLGSSKFVNYNLEVYGYLAQALGVLLAMYVIKLKPDLLDQARSFVPIVCAIDVLMVFISIMNSNTLVLILGYIMNLLVGIVLGYICYLITVYPSKETKMMVMAVSYAISTLLNAIVGLIQNSQFVQSFGAVVTYLIASLIVIVFYILGKDIRIKAEDVETKPHAVKVNKKIVLITGFLVMGMWCISNMGFYFPVEASGNTYYIAIRGIYGIGLILAGVLNTKDKRIGAMACLVSLVYPFFCVFAQHTQGMSLFLFVVAYFFTGFLAVYRMGIFADLSLGSDESNQTVVYLCGFGLIFQRAGEILGTIVGMELESDPLLLITVIAFVFVITILLFVIHYLLLFSPTPKVVQSYEDRVNNFRSKYGLTVREGDVLKFLLEGETNSSIAEKLFVSENTVRFHVSNILKKTQCTTRAEIINQFNKIEQIQ